ncbi:hypothetical protein PUV54_13105 [Hyphococcus flavus]|uniref:Uncharacterized protein n=1 Tax=Hyphococcus flavus TaxID=1866326 RepID=A0AAE9ZDE8_9PROT|nr:hypothetical protein [Hyphococcus flavus]WDI30892.1 hypothetical protein PUV54_13105 [Hyphococcus flavus]
MFNALAIGFISAAVFVPSGRTAANYTGSAESVGGVDSPLTTLRLIIQGETQELMGVPFGLSVLEPVAPIIPYLFIFIGFLLHLMARAAANRA